jgi:hypothetical protein
MATLGSVRDGSWSIHPVRDEWWLALWGWRQGRYRTLNDAVIEKQLSQGFTWLERIREERDLRASQ